MKLIISFTLFNFMFNMGRRSSDSNQCLKQSKDQWFDEMMEK